MILVSVIGNEVVHLSPLIFEFKSKITKHILVYDDAYYEQRKVNRMRHAIDYLNRTYGCNIEQFEAKIDEDSKADIDTLAGELFSYADSPRDIFLNPGDGPAHINIFLGATVLQQGGQVVVYDPMDNTYNLIYKNNMRNISIKNNMNAIDYCNMLGMEVIEFKGKKQIRYRKKEVIRLFRRYGGLKKVRRALGDGDRKFDYSEYESILHDLTKIGVIDKERNVLDRNFLYGGMFEEYVYWMIRRLDFDDVLLNAVVAIDQVGDALVKNEFDLLMMKNNHPYIIECKHKHNLNGDNIIYKYETVNDAFGPDAKVMIVNLSDKPKIKYKSRNISSSFSRGNINRAILNNIEVYHESRINEKKFLKKAMRFFQVGKRMKEAGTLSGSNPAEEEA